MNAKNNNMPNAEVRPVLKPLDGAADQLALEICRYRNHVSQLHDLDAGCRDAATKMREMDQQRHQMRGQLEAMMRTMTHVTAEARDQVGRLLAMGMTQEEISAIIPLPAVAVQLNIADVVPPRLRPAPPPPEAEVPHPGSIEAAPPPAAPAAEA